VMETRAFQIPSRDHLRQFPRPANIICLSTG
jgi:hypothetical protein